MNHLNILKISNLLGNKYNLAYMFKRVRKLAMLNFAFLTLNLWINMDRENSKLSINIIVWCPYEFVYEAERHRPAPRLWASFSCAAPRVANIKINMLFFT